MNIDLQTSGIPEEKDIDQFVRCRANLAIGSMREQIGLVSVYVERNPNAPETYCKVLIRQYARPDILIEGRDDNLYNAIRQTLDEAGWSLASELMRQQNDLIALQRRLIVSQAAARRSFGQAIAHQAA